MHDDGRIGSTAISLLSALVWLASARPASAELAASRPLRLEGSFDVVASGDDVLDVVTISADGRERRPFAVRTLQAYKPEEEGAQVLRPSSLHPITLLLRGTPALVDAFIAAAPGQHVVVYGVYRGGSGTFVLMSVDVAG